MNPPTPTPPPIEDILPPIAESFPAWIIALGIAAVLLIGWGVWLMVRRARRRRRPPLLPAEIFIRELDALAARAAALPAYELTVAACDVLRTYLAAVEPGLPRSRTSEEFLRAAAETPRFGQADRELLAGFLSTADRIKFARARVDHATAAELLTQARGLLRPDSTQ